MRMKAELHQEVSCMLCHDSSVEARKSHGKILRRTDFNRLRFIFYFIFYFYY